MALGFNKILLRVEVEPMITKDFPDIFTCIETFSLYNFTIIVQQHRMGQI
jgi:hypothetical protein